ncbi:MAG: hypothetical protein ACRDDY_13845 [Clostridium sp.]|uniref:hypothetical protein n=1 Tax=Clostridium sp. TaxID=1506 RepID=UPI003EE4E825
MDEFDPLQNYSITGKSSHADTILGLENIRNQIARDGMSRELYYAAEQVSPGSLVGHGINVRKLTMHPSDTGRKLAMEAIDVAAAAKGAAGMLGTGGTIAVGAALAGGVGYALYRFYKWIRSKMDSSKKEPADKSSNGTASEASGNYATKVSSIALPTDDESKKLLEEKTAGKDKTVVGVVNYAIGCAKKFDFQPSTTAALCDRVITLMDPKFGDGALPILYQLLQKKENVPQYWLVQDMVKVQELQGLIEYVSWVCKLIPLVAKPLADGDSIDKRVSEIVKAYQEGGITVSVSEFKDSNAKEGFLKTMLTKLLGVKWTQNPTLRDIIEGKKVGEVSESTHNTLADISKGTYSIYAGLPGSGLSAQQKAIGEEEFGKTVAMYDDSSSGVRAGIERCIAAMAMQWSACASELGKSDFTESDAKNMATIQTDGNTEIGMAYSALAQSITKHAGYALRIKSTYDQISNVLADISNKFKEKD